jgi:adenosine kinase
MNYSHQNDASKAHEISLGIVSPDGRDGMLNHCRQFHAAGIPFVFDPGQGMPLFSGAELLEMVELADYVTLNDYEAELLLARTGLSVEALAAKVKCLVITRGEAGSRLYVDGTMIEVPVVQATQVLDPTGCGDAFRAGLLYGIAQGLDWETSGQLASVMGAIKIEHRGGQNHQPTRDAIAARLQQAFGKTL